MSEQRTSRIADAKRRAFAAKRTLAACSVTAFVAVAALAWTSHPGTATTATPADDESLVDDEGGFSGEDDDFRGFDSFQSLAPSGGAAPQVQGGVS